MPARGTIDDATRMRVVAWLRREREEQGFGSIRALAKRLDVSHSYLARVLGGAQAPGLDLILRLTRIFGLSADRVLNEDPPRRYFLAAEPVAGTRHPERPPRRPGSRPIDVDEWLARARATRRFFKGQLTEDDLRRWKGEGRK